MTSSSPGPRRAARPSRPPRPDLVVLSHLRWSWVWQRPQHLVSRLARSRVTWFVEEPEVADVDRPQLVVEPAGAVHVVRWVVPGDAAARGHVGFDAPECDGFADALRLAAGDAAPLAWLYTPLALPLADALAPAGLVYDVMDDLASFKGASPLLRGLQRDALARADVVFAGGRSLHAGVAATRPDGTHLFPSGVETEHYRPAGLRRLPRPGGRRPVAGYVGVIDERLDLDLVAGLADELPDWEVRLVGPVAKIDPADLPRRPNLAYPGPAAYAELPEVMAGFDVALMPFALNEATRSISPTKTLEYLSADLAVVSTRVPDVVADHADVVALEDDAAGFAAACRRILDDYDVGRHRRHCRAVLDHHHWDRIAERMEALIAESCPAVGERDALVASGAAFAQERSA